MRYLRLMICAALMGLLLVSSVVSAQTPADGYGVIRESTTGSLNVSTYQPLRCDDDLCEHLTGLLFPPLFQISPQTHFYTPADTDSVALVTDWRFNETGDALTLTIREDLTWSDGTPITAADVAFTYQYLLNAVDTPFFEQIADDYQVIAENVTSADRVDAQTVTLQLNEPDCEALYWLDTRVVPAHVLGLPDGTRNAAADAQFDTAPPVTGGVFEFVGSLENTYIRLQHTRADGRALTYELVPVASESDQVARLFQGDITLLREPSVSAFDDLRGNPDLETVLYPATRWSYLAFNLADPTAPENAFDADGNPIEQGVHPVFGDVRVRQAAQLAVNVPELIQSALNGYGVPMASAVIPQISSFEDTTLAAPEYNLQAAQRLLDDAGWKLYEGRSVRVCDGCTTADPGTPLRIDLAYNSGVLSLEPAAILIARHLREAGFQVTLTTALFEDVSQQRFDAYLAMWFQGYPVTPAADSIFTRETDVVGSGFNIGSYHSDELNALIEEADTTCDPDARQALYNEIQQILRDDAPYLWLYTPQTLTATRAGVQHEVMPPQQPFWNVREWVIWQTGNAERGLP